VESRIKEIAIEVLAQDPGPVVHFRLLKEVLGTQASDPRLVQAQLDTEFLYAGSEIKLMLDNGGEVEIGS